MKFLAAVLLSLTLGTAQAQTPAQWSQLVTYVGKLATRMLEQQTEIEDLKNKALLHRVVINELITALEQERCKIAQHTEILTALGAPPPEPLNWEQNGSCINPDSQFHPFPTPLP